MSDEAAARDAFAAWAAAQTGAPRDVASLIEGVDVSHEPIGLLESDLQGRRVVWKSVPVSGRSRVTFASIALQDVDAWTAEPAPLRQRSDHVAVCDVCVGEKKVACAACGGTGKVTCTACDGQRKYYGRAANGSRRWLNCATCRGKGDVDCAGCRRGIASCEACGGEGRVQRWIELEWWRRSEAGVHPERTARAFGWEANPPAKVVALDAEIAVDVEKPRRLAPPDLGNASKEWLDILAPAMHDGERIERQRLRIACVPTHTVRYRLGSDDDRIAFVGRRLVAAPADGTACARRAASLGRLRIVLIVAGLIAAIASLSRGAFYISVPTLVSLLAFAVALGAIHGAACDWTAARRRTRDWLLTAAAFVVIAAAIAFAALPRLAHAQRMIAAGRLDQAEEELTALGDAADAGTWADLRLARIRAATDLELARAALAKLRPDSPQRGPAVDALDTLILQLVDLDARASAWSKAAEKLALLSDRARGKRPSVAAAKTVFVPMAEGLIGRKNWPGAADALAAARHIGVSRNELEPLVEKIRAAANDAMDEARRESDPGRRLRLRIAAEAMLVAWEHSTGNWGTPALIELRTAMARDVVAIERPARRRRAA